MENWKRVWVAALAVSAMALGAETPRRPMVMMVMMDGLRSDAVENAHMPNLRRLMDGKWAEGYNCAWTLSGQTMREARPSSSGNHTALATGVEANKTKVFDHVPFTKGDFAKWPTWLSRVAATGRQALFVYSWPENKDLGVDPKVQFRFALDKPNDEYLRALLATSEAPDALMYFINLPDIGGHMGGFYPYTPKYLYMAELSDRYLGDCLAAIKSRSTFAKEDWLILVTGDHGGYARTHGIWGGHCTTVPVVACGKNVKQGRIPGAPPLYALTSSAIAHFGLDVTKLDLDAAPVGGEVAAPYPTCPLAEGLAVYQNFDEQNPKGVTVFGSATKSGVGGVRDVDCGKFGGCLRVAADAKKVGGARLDGTEKLKFADGCFAFTLWTRMPATQTSDPLLLGNKDWDKGRNPGIALVASRVMDGVKTPGVAFNCGLVGNERFDLGVFDVEPGLWTFYAVVRDAEGVVTVYQGRNDGMLYRVAGPNPQAIFATGLPFCIGQDGTSRYAQTLKGDVDDFALWTRALTPAEVRRIFTAGRAGAPLGDLLNP